MSDLKVFIWPNGINSGCFQSHISQNVAKSMLSLTSQSCSNSLLAVCLSMEDKAIYKPPPGHLQTSDKLKKEASIKAYC